MARDRRAEQVINDALRVVASPTPTRDVAVEHRIVPGHGVPALAVLSKDADMIVAAGGRGLGGVEGLLPGLRQLWAGAPPVLPGGSHPR